MHPVVEAMLNELCEVAKNEMKAMDLYQGTSKGAESYAARMTFKRAKEEGMNVGRMQTSLPMDYTMCTLMQRS